MPGKEASVPFALVLYPSPLLCWVGSEGVRRACPELLLARDLLGDCPCPLSWDPSRHSPLDRRSSVLKVKLSAPGYAAMAHPVRSHTRRRCPPCTHIIEVLCGFHNVRGPLILLQFHPALAEELPMGDNQTG